MSHLDTTSSLRRTLCAVIPLVLVSFVSPDAASADPALECGTANSSQVEIADCIAQQQATVDRTVTQAFGFARDSAADLDRVTERQVAVPALEAGQAAWSLYRDAHCAYVGRTFGGGSGAGIAEGACRILLGRARVAELMMSAQ